MHSKEKLHYALGMIETKGLIGAIEAADAACKAAAVRLVGREKVKGALVNIKVVGEVAAVRSAIEAGAAAAQKVGGLVGYHIIPNPTKELEPYIFDLPISNEVASELLQDDEPDIQNEEPVRSSAKDDNEIVLVDLIEETDAPDQINMGYSEFGGADDEFLSELEEMTVHELRKTARSVKGLEIFGREISKANKEKLISEIMKARHKK
jgi:microcompartment protein CcmL/EutN